MDPGEALTLPGVKTYVNSDDVPGNKYVLFDEEVFATVKVHQISLKWPLPLFNNSYFRSGYTV